jgi:hypothetical protein
MGFGWCRETKLSFFHRQIGAGRNNIKMLAFYRHAVGCLGHLQRRVAGQEFNDQALVRRIQVLH